jgi:hypothetical protein
MSETTPLNEWPVEKLYLLKSIFLTGIKFYNTPLENKMLQNDINQIDIAISSAIKDAEEKLNELPFK